MLPLVLRKWAWLCTARLAYETYEELNAGRNVVEFWWYGGC